MKNWKWFVYWILPVACVVAQLVVATIDHATWTRYLPSQNLVMCMAFFAVLPFLCAGILSGWLLTLGLRFDKQTRIRLLWIGIKAKLIFLGALIGWIGFVSAIGPMVPPSSDYSAGLTSLICLTMLPPVLAFTYEYQEFRKLRPDIPKSRIAAYLALTFLLSVISVIILAIAILVVLFFYGCLMAIGQNI